MGGQGVARSGPGELAPVGCVFDAHGRPCLVYDQADVAAAAQSLVGGKGEVSAGDWSQHDNVGSEGIEVAYRQAGRKGQEQSDEGHEAKGQGHRLAGRVVGGIAKKAVVVATIAGVTYGGVFGFSRALGDKTPVLEAVKEDWTVENIGKGPGIAVDIVSSAVGMVVGGNE